LHTLIEKSECSSNTRRQHDFENVLPLFGTDNSVPYVVSKILAKGRYSIPKAILALEDGVQKAYTKFMENGEYCDYMEVPGPDEFGSIKKEMYTHPAVLEALKMKGMMMTKVDNLADLNMKYNTKTRILIYGALNPLFTCKKYPDLKVPNVANHVIFVRNGLIRCVHLKEAAEGNIPWTLRAKKCLKIVNRNGLMKTDDNSYLEVIKAAYIIHHHSQQEIFP
jgi:hypothetical protein